MTTKAPTSADMLAQLDALKAELDQKKLVAAAIGEIDISGWLGWGEGIPVLNCMICEERTEGEITLVLSGNTALHKRCMVAELAEAPTSTFDQIREQLERGEPLFGEDGE